MDDLERRAVELSNLIYPDGRMISLEFARAGLERFCEALPVPDDVRVEQVDAGGVSADWLTMPESSPQRTLLYLHGGGFVIGSAYSTREMAAAFARAGGARALVVDYRLAPEHPFPAAHDDVLTAYRWLLSTGCPAQEIVIAGESAGGSLVMSTLVGARDAGLALPAAAVVVAPWVDLTVPVPSAYLGLDAHEVEVTLDGLGKGAKLYLDGADPTSPIASPIFADLTGLPPLLVMVGAAEGMVEESLRLAQRAAVHGVDVTLELAPTMLHVHTFFSSFLPEGRAGVERVGQFMDEQLARHRGD